MKNYKEIYFLLFNKITDTIESLQEIQQQAEEMYIAQDESSSDINYHQKNDMYSQPK